MEKVTMVLGASPNPDRFSYKAIRNLQRRRIPVIAVGRRDAEIEGLRILTGLPAGLGYIHTVTLYMNAKYQGEYFDYILSLNPKRIIFNPGTTNPLLAAEAKKRGIEVLDDCILVMLNTGKF